MILDSCDDPENTGVQDVFQKALDLSARLAKRVPTVEDLLSWQSELDAAEDQREKLRISARWASRLGMQTLAELYHAMDSMSGHGRDRGDDQAVSGHKSD